MSCKATFQGVTIAQSDYCLTTEGVLYFPAQSIVKQYFTLSEHRYHCAWKGDAGYYDLTINGHILENAAWFYDHPTDAAGELKDFVAFDRSLGIITSGQAAKLIRRPENT